MKLKIITSLIFFSLIFSFVIYYNSQQKLEVWDENKIIENSFIENKTWESGLQKDIPFVKWDEIDYVYIMKPQKNKEVTIELNKIKEKIDISQITINWEKKDLNWDKIKLSLEEALSIKISWEANHNKVWKENIEENLKVTFNEIEEDNQAEEIEEPTEKQNTSPTNIKLEKYSFNWNLNNLLIISWENIDTIQTITIWDYSFSPLFKDWKAFININAWTFSWWSYFVIIKTKSWNLVTLNKKVSFEFMTSDVAIWNITPREINNNKSNYLVLQWQGFDKIISVQLSNNVIIKKTEFEIINDKVATIKIPKGINSWNYHFNIMTTSWISELRSQKFKINHKE